MLGPAPGSDLDEHQFVSFLGHDVHFTPAAPVVGVEQPVAFLLKKPAPHSFSPFAQADARRRQTSPYPTPWRPTGRARRNVGG